MKRRLLAAALLTTFGATLAAFAGPGAAAGPAVYTADPATSRLEFSGIQAGAEFKAVFHKFTATVEFAPDALATSRFDVVIDAASVDSGDKDRDTTIKGPDIFDVAHFPTAHYVTRSFTKTATGFSATGALTLRGVTKDVPIEFRFTPGAQPKLDGTANLKRLDFGAGQGDWKSTEWVKDEVKVRFALVLVAKP